MGMSDPILYEKLYYPNIIPEGEVALLGFTNNQRFKGDLYDLQLGNWNINSDWKLEKKYDTIICLRTAYFAKDPVNFIKKCYESLNDGGMLHVDWGLGDHWRYENYKIGWLKDGEQEQAYEEGNYLWSTVWDNEKIGNNEEFLVFKDICKEYGYDKINKELIYKEVPNILTYQDIEKHFSIIEQQSFDLTTRSVWTTADNVNLIMNSRNDLPQFYVLLKLKKLKKEK